MTDYIKEKTYDLSNNRQVTFFYNELGEGMITVEAMDAFIDMINSSVEVVRCKDCKYHYSWKDVDDCFYHACEHWGDNLGYDADVGVNCFCSYGERADNE